MTNTSVLSLAVFTAEAGDTNIFARTHIWGGEGHLSFSTNNGMRWTDVSTGLPYTSACALAVFPDSTGSINLFAGTYSGVWRRSSSEMITSVHSPTSELSDEFLLLHNFSNPFNPSTTVKFELPRASHVSLTVYDILGGEVSVLVDERKEAGVHEVKFDGSRLASGVYVYRMQAGDFVQTHKLLSLRR